MNNEPPLILISKQLLIVYEAPTRWSREGRREEEKLEGREKKKEKIHQEKVKEWKEWKTQWPQNYYLIVIFFFFLALGIRMHDKHLIQSPKSNSPASIYLLIFCIDPGAGCRTLQQLKEHKTSLISWKRPEIGDSTNNKSSLLKNRILIEG